MISEFVGNADFPKPPSTSKWAWHRWVSGPSNPLHTHDIHPIPEGARTGAPSHVREKVLRRQVTIVYEEQGDQERASRLLDAAEAEAIAVSERPLLKL